MRFFHLLLLFLTGCAESQSPEPVASACHEQTFDGSRFTVCAARRGAIEVRTAGRNGRPYRSFAALQPDLAEGPVAFGMNAGMFDADGRAIGLLIEDSKERHKLNTRKGGGNFHLLPNGVYLVRRDGSSEVVTTAAFKQTPDITFATQSGPMLVIANKLHPAFELDGQSRNIRNGVGIASDGTAIFVISEDFVSFGKLARFFRDALHTRDALYFDGSVSSLWDPANGRQDSGVPIGPMVIVFRPEASAPGRAGRARP